MRTGAVASAMLLALVAGATGWSAEADLHNLEHVYNFTIPPKDGNPTGTDLEFYSTGGSDYAVVGAMRVGAYVFDITDPEQPILTSAIACDQSQNDVQLKRFGDRWILALALDDGLGLLCLPPVSGHPGGGGISLFDVTDPAAPMPMFSVPVVDGAHNFTFHPTEPFGWVSSGDLPGGRDLLRIVDFTDLDNPTVVAELRSVGGPHDVAFNADGSRAYVASENNIRIYDTSVDPANPNLVSATVTPGTYAHDAFPTPDGETMIVVNESLALGGFFAPGVCPGEGLTTYRIGGALERAPVPSGYFLADIAGQTAEGYACTAHVGRTSPSSLYHVLGWYSGGVRVVDIANPSVPLEIGHAVMPGAEVWAAKTYKGPYVYAADQVRGFDVFRWTDEQRDVGA